jgi:hypothetical protein
VSSEIIGRNIERHATILYLTDLFDQVRKGFDFIDIEGGR